MLAAEELLHPLAQGKLQVEQAAVTEYHDKERQAPLGRADAERTETAPIGLGTFSRGKVQSQIGRLAHRANQTNEGFEDAVGPGVACAALKCFWSNNWRILQKVS